MTALLARTTSVRLVVASLGAAGLSVAVIAVGPMSAARSAWAQWSLLLWVGFSVLLVLALVGPAPSGRRAQRRAAAVLLLGTALCQLPGLTQPPLNSTDAYRYVWDGRVQLAGVSPYRYAPGDDALARLRDPVLFPGLGPDESSGLTTVRPLPEEPRALFQVTRNDDRIRINRPQVPTIYPPVGQLWFALVALLTPWSAGTLGLQVGAAVLAVAVTGGLAWLLARTGRDVRWAATWGLCPLLVDVAASSAHVDVLGTALLVLAAGVLARRPSTRGRVVGGLVVGLAIATKLIPLLLLPAFAALRRGGRRELAVVPAALVGTAVTYVPYVLGAGWLVLGFLPAYVVEEGFNDGRSRFGVLALVPGLPLAWRWPVAVVVALVTVAWTLWTADPRRPWDAATVLYGVALLVATPTYPWYALPLLAMAALARRPEWLAVVAAGWVAYAVAGDLHGGRLAWAAAAAFVVLASAARWVTTRRRAGAPAAGDPVPA